ncbi:hypothetical protein [Mucilaginibacter segetis]|uniref:Uncharacterized protein n=1 Tax=Mucilaginibacter segetis TaxID=2793071 RepID=A0A934PXS8_9SPHI|nr:hypothetical protein [Mucilaginibacter segetis]MBK0381041.1 hypothetical protein [Mucilaginibacter segetis]
MKTAMEQLPKQETGRQTDFTHEQKLEDVEAAHQAFVVSAGRLLSVNNWHAYAGAGSAKFTLCNNQGQEVEVMAEEGFFFSINLPGPGSDAGDGQEWVMIEKLISEGSAHTAEEYVLMTVRPVPDPRKADETIAHFFKDVSTSTFIVRRDGLTVSAGAHGRNETPNNGDVDLHDKIRNTAIALMARVGLSGPQWQKLVNGLIDYKE